MNNPLEQFINKNAKRAEEYLEILSSMIGDPAYYGYAESTLLSIYEYIEEHNQITDKQVEAIQNIRENPSGKHR